MSRALLIVIMDFLVASLFLYVSEPGTAGKGHQPLRSAIEASETVEPVPPLALTEAEAAWDREMEAYSRERLARSSDEKVAALREENLRLDAVIVGQHRALEEAAVSMEAQKRKTEEKSGEIASLEAREEALSGLVAERDAALERYRETLLERERILDAMQRMNEKAVEDARQARQEVAEKTEAVHEKTLHLLDAEKRIAEQGQQLREAEKAAQEAEARHKASISEKDQVIGSMQRVNEKAIEDSRKAAEALTQKIQESERKGAQLRDAEKSLADQTRKAEASQEAEELAKRAEQGREEQKRVNEELVASLIQRDRAVRAAEAAAREAEERLRAEAAEKVRLETQIKDLENRLADREKRAVDAEYARKVAEQDLAVEKIQRKELLEKTRDTVVQIKEEEALRHQETMERFADLRESQGATLKAIEGMESKIDRIPEMFREGMAEVLHEARALLHRTDLLKSELERVAGAMDPQENKQILKEIEVLKDTNQRIEAHLKEIGKGESAQKVEENIKAVEDLSRKQREIQTNVDAQAATALARSRGIFAMVNEARVQIDGMLRAKGTLWGYNTKEIRTYPVSVKAGGRAYFLAHAETLGLSWGKISDRLDTATYALRTGPTVSGALDNLRALASPCKILAAPDAGTPSPLGLYPSLAALRERALGNLHIFKNAVRMSDIKVESGASLDEAKRTITLDRGFFDRISSSSNPEAGDFVVSAEGFLVGVMEDWKTCLILLEDDLSSLGTAIASGSPASFVRSVSAYRQSCP